VSSPCRVAALASLIGCSGGEAPAVPEVAADTAIAECRDYVRSEDVYNWCVQEHGREQPTVARMEEYCGHLLAPPAAARCRSAWVADQLHQSPQSRAAFEVLIGACGPAPDCRFLVVDQLPDADMLIQGQHCEEYAGSFVSDCIGHALQRWAARLPGDTERARVDAAFGARWGEQTGYWTGLAAACGGAGGCPSSGASAEPCERERRRAEYSPQECHRLKGF
jgi:hypothetical protein